MYETVANEFFQILWKFYNSLRALFCLETSVSFDFPRFQCILALNWIYRSIVESLSVEGFHEIEWYSLKCYVLIAFLFSKIRIIQVWKTCL